MESNSQVNGSSLSINYKQNSFVKHICSVTMREDIVYYFMILNLNLLLKLVYFVPLIIVRFQM